MVKEKKKTKSSVKEPVKKFLVVSRLIHPVTISYEGKALVIPARGRVKVDDRQKLGALPNGVVVR